MLWSLSKPIRKDAVVLADCLANAIESIPTALRRFEQVRKARAHKIVHQSWNIGRMGQLEHPLGRWLRNGLVAITPDSVAVRGMERVWNVHVPG